jgi:hypothetical protein
VVIAGADFDPGIGDADKRFLEIVVLEATRAKHGARARATCSID